MFSVSPSTRCSALTNAGGRDNSKGLPAFVTRLTEGIDNEKQAKKGQGWVIPNLAFLVSSFKPQGTKR